MAEAKALRNIPKLAGKAYEAGDVIPAAVIAKITPQVLRSLVETHTIEVPGMQSQAGSPGQGAHMMARLDKQADQIKGLLAANMALEKRIAAIEGKKPAKSAPAPKAAAAKAE